MITVDVDLLKYQQMVKDYHAESDRAAAVLAGSFMEAFTQKFLRSTMVADPKVEEMFHAYGPLSTFSACIDCLYAFGLIDAGIRDDMDMIRKIRNHFAHHPEQTSFNDSPARDYCSRLSTAKPMKREDGSDHAITDRRFQYLLIIGMIVAKMHNAMIAREQQKT